jgi:hypothetical protein
MGNGGALPDAVQAHVIVPALNYMFDLNGGLPQTQVSFRQLKRFYRHLGDHQDHDQGTNLRQRSLRHLAWLLTDHIFDGGEYQYPNPRFRLWLRYLTWVEHFATNYSVTVDGRHSNERPAAAIKRTIIISIRDGREILFDWQPGSGNPELTVDVTRATDPMKIFLTSIKQEHIPTTVTSDYDDELRQI